MLLVSSQGIRPVLNLGVPAEPLLVSRGFVVVELTDLARVLSEICVVEVACLPPPRLGGAGIAG